MNHYLNHYMKYLALLILAAFAFPAFAVTDKEMEEAKTIAAQTYLRYANDGSGYLDEFKATTMSQLESKLKAKEKENLEAFKTVKVPTDYASWDKAKLVEFWSVTFFSSPNLTAKGKVGRNRVKSRINAMTIAPPSAAKPEPVKEEPVETTPKAEEKQATPAAEAAEAVTPQQKEEEILEKQEEILADQNAIAQDEQQRTPSKHTNTSTWVYVIILIILIGVVIWLVVFAANTMKKQAEPLEHMGADPKELDKLQEKYKAAKDTMEQYRAAFEDEKQQNQALRNEIKVLKEQLAVLQSAERTAPARRQPAPRPVAESEEPVRRKPKAETEQPATRQPKSAKEFYLGRVNSRGLFIRADRQFNPGHSIYRLETQDGLVGTFHVVDRPEVADLVLDHPVEYLGGGCTAIDLEDTADADRIVTENAGTAVFEGGAWKVLRRSRIRYE